ncbi:MAG: hypothetical protein MJB12_16455 [Firmicutes bacterium]|nr:hypothetical protein [Bacillota bacterium]
MRWLSLNQNELRSLRGTIYYALLYIREIAFYFLIIIGVATLIGSFSLVYMVVTDQDLYLYSRVLNTAVLAALIMIIIIGVQTSSKKELRLAFIFPTDKKIYVLGNLIGTVINISLLLLMASLLLIVEILVVKVISIFNPGLFFTSSITPANYLIGFWLALTLLSVIYSLSFCLLAGKNKKLLLLILVALTTLSFSFPLIRQGLWNFVLFFIRPESVLLFSLKAWLLVFVLNILGYMLIKNREVI